MWNPAYKGKVSVPSISGTHGLNLVVVAAALATGKPFHEAQYETDAAFKQLVELKANLHSIFVQNALVMTALKGPFYSNTIWPYIDSGLLID
jgi:putative spermidine/putrescine transport system substrate-binding protein